MKSPRLVVLSATGTARKRTLPAVVAGKICEIVGLHGRDEAKLKSLGAQYSVPYLSKNAADLLDKAKPDFVFIGSPPLLHPEQINLCIDRALPILCEKPLCLSTDVARQLQERITSSRVPFRLAHHLRHQPGVKALRALLASSSLGRLRGGSMQWGFWMNDAAGNASWKMAPESGGPSAFYDAGIHVVDLALHLLPSPSRVLALAGHSRLPRTQDHVGAVLDCAGAVVLLSASQSVRSPGNDLVLDFENGTVRVPHAFGEASFSQIEISTAAGTRTETFPEENLYGAEIRDFIGLLAGAQSVATTIHEAVRGQEILDAITESCNSGMSVSLG